MVCSTLQETSTFPRQGTHGTDCKAENTHTRHTHTREIALNPEAVITGPLVPVPSVPGKHRSFSPKTMVSNKLYLPVPFYHHFTRFEGARAYLSTGCLTAPFRQK